MTPYIPPDIKCPHTGLHIPECSCKVCVERLIATIAARKPK